MVDLRLKFLVEDRDRHGNARLYFRRGGKKTRIRSPIGSDDFNQEYAAALAGLPWSEQTAKAIAIQPAAPKSLLWLCRKYMDEAPDFKALSPESKRIRRSHLERLCLEPASKDDPTPVGSLPAEMPVSKLITLRDRLADTPEAANSRLKAIRRVYAWAIPLEHASYNPARDISRIKTGSTGHHTWTLEEVQQFERRHPIGTKAFLALSIILLLGVRRSDTVLLGRPHVRQPEQISERLRRHWGGKWVKFTVFKGRNRSRVELQLPILPRLEEILSASPTGRLTWMETEYKKPFTAAGFGNWFRDRCDEADLHHCSAHGLRKAGSTIAAENGATAHMLMAIFGWKTLAQAEVYTKAADQKRLAADGMHLLISDQR